MSRRPLPLSHLDLIPRPPLPGRLTFLASGTSWGQERVVSISQVKSPKDEAPSTWRGQWQVTSMMIACVGLSSFVFSLGDFLNPSNFVSPTIASPVITFYITTCIEEITLGGFHSMFHTKPGEDRTNLRGAPDTSCGLFEATSHSVFCLSLTRNCYCPLPSLQGQTGADAQQTGPA